MEQLEHFSHEHLLSLIQLQPDHNNENSDTEDEDENGDKDGIVVDECHVGKCMMCDEEIYSFHLCYYSCKDCGYYIHKLCAQLPKTYQNHPLHPDHNLVLSTQHPFHDMNLIDGHSTWECHICNIKRSKIFNYHCSICKFTIDIICATISEQKMDHPSHPHQLWRYFRPMISCCNACGDEHSGTFYHCTTCLRFMIHLNCALLPTKLLIQQSTQDNFIHHHILTLTYSFPYIESAAKFGPRCRVCDDSFNSYTWHYRCDKCRYYVHILCATSRREAFMSIIRPVGLEKTYKNFKDDDHPNLINGPFPDESVNLVKHYFINKGESIIKRNIDGQMFGHQGPLILVDTHLNGSMSLHDPLKKVELLCDGCVRPITAMPFYKGSQHHCSFVLHEWCTRLPSNIEHYYGHKEHTLFFHPKVPGNSLGMFWCEICALPCNGFAYGCIECDYYVDTHCAFIPDAITHEAHPNHLLIRLQSSSDIRKYCKACWRIFEYEWIFSCPTCDFYLHVECAMLLPRTIRHRYDSHPLSLRYYPAENHSSEYFCEICEDEFDPKEWFYHCDMCTWSMHAACTPLKLLCENFTYPKYAHPIYVYLNVKFGRIYSIPSHPHHLTFVQGINDDGQCVKCAQQLQYSMIFKCFQCKFAFHMRCVNINC